MASCKKIKNQIYLDSMGWLSKRSKIKVEKHLKGCPDCRQVMREARELAGNINGDTLFPSEKEINWDSFMERVYVKIHDRLREKEKGVPLFTIGLGSKIDEDSLIKLSSDTGGHFFKATTPEMSAIVDIMKIPVEAIISTGKPATSESRMRTMAITHVIRSHLSLLTSGSDFLYRFIGSKPAMVNGRK